MVKRKNMKYLHLECMSRMGTPDYEKVGFKPISSEVVGTHPNNDYFWDAVTKIEKGNIVIEFVEQQWGTTTNYKTKIMHFDRVLCENGKFEKGVSILNRVLIVLLASKIHKAKRLHEAENRRVEKEMKQSERQRNRENNKRVTRSIIKAND